MTTAVHARDWLAILAPGVLPAFAVLLSAVMSAGVAIYAVRLNGRQVENERDKLRLALFEKRYAVWVLVRDAVRDYQMAATKWAAGDFKGDLPQEMLSLGLAANETMFLFGDEVKAQIAKVQAAIEHLTSYVSDRGVLSSELAQRRKQMQIASKELDDAQKELVRLMNDYMSVADVGRPT